jgi:transcriptional regulator with XRE-family HTH domain
MSEYEDYPYDEEQPFVEAVEKLHASGVTFQEMAKRCGGVRSAAWWNRVARNRNTDPPPWQEVDKIAQVLGVTPRRVQELIAQDWYGVTPFDGVSERTRRMSAVLDGLTDEDAEFVSALAHRLHQDRKPGKHARK